MQLSPALRTWLLHGDHPDPYGTERAIRHKLVARLDVSTVEDLRAHLNTPLAFEGFRTAYSDDQPRDDHGRWSPEGAGDVFMHGTSANRLTSILKEGITTAHAGETFSNYSQKGYTYISTSEQEAKDWARWTAAQNIDASIDDAAILRVEIPQGERSKLELDPNFTEIDKKTDTLRFHGDIKPEWIKEVNIGRVNMNSNSVWQWQGFKKASQFKTAEVGGRVIYVLILFKPDGTVYRAAGGEGSGNFSHEGRPGEVGGSGPGGEGATPDPRLAAESVTGIAACEKLLDRSMDGADFSAAPSTDDNNQDNWDKVPDQTKESVLQDFFENAGDIDVDTTELDQDWERDLRKDNGELTKEAETNTLSELSTAFPNENPTLPGEGFPAYRTLDPETLTYGEDDGDGAHLEDLQDLRFKDGEKLTEAEQARVSSTWDEQYSQAFDETFKNRYEDSSYQDQESELRSQAEEDAWNHLSNDEKLKMASDAGYDLGEAARIDVDPGLPQRWVTGIDPDADRESENYLRTAAIAKEMVVLRTGEILRERGLNGSIDNPNKIDQLWSAWKGAPTREDALAMQYATSLELHGVSRLTDDEKATAIRAAGKFGGVDSLRAYSRAQWETTQFVMSKSGEERTTVYRGINLPIRDLDRTTNEGYTRSGQLVPTLPTDIRDIHNITPYVAEYTRLPDVYLQRGALQSTTGTLSVANNWSGVGVKEYNTQRTVLRIDAPRTSVFSIPVYGQNEQEEHETVLAGTKDRWEWDLWRNRAPDVKDIPIIKMPKLKAAARRATSARLVIDLQAADRGPLHWLSKTDMTLVRWQEKRRALRTAGGQGSGNFGHGGRPGEVGGSGPGGPQVTSPAFKQWFGRSKVVDGQGQPLVVYHATKADPQYFRSGTHFGTVNAANQRAEDLRKFSEDTVHRPAGPLQVMPAYLSVENPLRLPDLAALPPDDPAHQDPEKDEAPESRAWEHEGDLMTTLYERDVVSRDEFFDHQYAKDREVYALLTKKGYDGIVYKNAFEDKGSDSWIIFHPNQAKSALGNTGAFSRKTKLITGGGSGSGNFGHAGRPGEIGGSAPSVDVGITAARPGVPAREVFQHMHEFEDKLTHLPNVRNVSVQPGVGAWQGGMEPTWVVHYHGNGQATKLLAETGKTYNQDAVLVMRGARASAESSPVTEWTFTHGISAGQRDAVGKVLSEHGMGGWTWYKSGGRAVLRAVAVPQWGGKSAEHLEASHDISRTFTRAGLNHTLYTASVKVDVMERSGEHSYDSVLKGGV